MATNDNSSDGRPQAIHPSLLPKLDPQYIQFHNEHIAHRTPPHTLPWDPAIRNAPAVPGGSEPLPVGKVADFDVGKTKVRVYFPDGDVPEGGWNVFLFFHGGGWTLGTISSEASFITNMCVRAKCVVASVHYRLGPEEPYPAAVEDAVDSLVWLYKEGPKLLNINPKRIAVGGSSSGGNLAAILAIKAKDLEEPTPIILQLLIVPVTDNTASAETRWASNKDTVWLSPDRMNWFKYNYLPNEEDWRKWDASPIFATREMLEGLPSAWIAVAELDILRDEGIAFGEMLKEAGVKVDIEVYKGAPHPIMAMDGALAPAECSITEPNLPSTSSRRDLPCLVEQGGCLRCWLFDNNANHLYPRALEIGRKLVSDAAIALRNAFETTVGDASA